MFAFIQYACVAGEREGQRLKRIAFAIRHLFIDRGKGI
jgi:hypothetical protein